MSKKSIVLPKHPSPDKIIAAAILMHAGKASGAKVISMLPHEKWQMEIDGIPVGLNVDYRQIDWRSYTVVIVSEHGIPRTPEIQRLVELANKNVQHKTERGSFNDIFNAIFSAQFKHPDEFTDERIVKEGVQCVFDLIQFSKLGLQRDKWSIGILQKEVQKVGAKRVPRLVQYLEQITSGMKIDCDIVELLTARKKLKGEAEATKFAAKIVRIYNLANQVFQEAMQLCKSGTIVKKTDTRIIVATNTDNPVFLGAANVWFKQSPPAITIQQLSSGHVQIFFRSNVPEEVSDDLTSILRAEDLKLCKADESSLSKEGQSPEVPMWFYVKGPYGDRMLLNASIRIGTESIAATRIPLPKILDFAALALGYS